MACSISKNDANTCHLCNRSMHFSIVFRTLAETLGNQASFLFPADDRTIRVVFVVIDPTKTNGFATSRKFNGFEDSKSFETVNFTLHSGLPNVNIRSSERFMIIVKRLG